MICLVLLSWSLEFEVVVRQFKRIYVIFSASFGGAFNLCIGNVQDLPALTIDDIFTFIIIRWIFHQFSRDRLHSNDS